jgi:predicted aspartyl protease
MERRGNGKMGRVTVELELANYVDMVLAKAGKMPPEQVRRLQARGVVDTGATRLVLPKSIVTQLGLPSAGKAGVRYADQRRATRTKVKDVWLKLQGREGTFNAIVEPDRTDVLVGAIVMEDLDFVVDCTTQTIHPRDPKLVISEIE